MANLDLTKAKAHSVPTTVLIGTGAGKGGGCALEFEAHVRRLLSTGMSAVAVRDFILMNAEFLLSPEEFKKVVVPEGAWSHQEGSERTNQQTHWLPGAAASYQRCATRTPRSQSPSCRHMPQNQNVAIGRPMQGRAL